MYSGGGFWFGDGPYESVANAKLARSTIGACPKDDPQDEPRAECDGGCRQKY
jgi:hypothetical protein